MGMTYYNYSFVYYNWGTLVEMRYAYCFLIEPSFCSRCHEKAVGELCYPPDEMESSSYSLKPTSPQSCGIE